MRVFGAESNREKESSHWGEIFEFKKTGWIFCECIRNSEAVVGKRACWKLQGDARDLRKGVKTHIHQQKRP